MLKILVIDRCHFTRTGIEALLNHSGSFSSSFLVSGINNLLLAKEHILQWKPHLVIADLYSFISETHTSPPIKPFFMSCGVIPLILLQSVERQHTSIASSQSVAHSVLTKHTTLKRALTHDSGGTTASPHIRNSRKRDSAAYAAGGESIVNVDGWCE